MAKELEYLLKQTHNRAKTPHLLLIAAFSLGNELQYQMYIKYMSVSIIHL